MNRRPSPNQDRRPAGTPIDTLILHYTGMASAEAALDRLCDPAARVSAHYVVDEDGTIWSLVDEERRAFHAGVSHWRGMAGLNDRSIGIEIVNPGHEHGYRPFPVMQLAATCDLCLDILGRHPIPPVQVVGHSDVAPDRKTDPGELFPWQDFAANGVGLWPSTDGRPCADPLAALAAIGYRRDLPADVLLRAFQRHWRPEAVTGVAEAGTCARVAAVAALTGPPATGM